MALHRTPTDREMALARRRCGLVLRRFRVAPPAVALECQITVCIPVHDESIERLQQQIRAYTRQRFPRERFEIVYLVNNDRPKNTPPRVLRANRRAIRFLRGEHPITVQVIDCSSPGREIVGCNVGLARNIGLHAVAAGYLAQKRDGIIIFSDADTVPVKRDYLRAVWHDLRTDRVAGAAGGLEFELDPDSARTSDRTFFRKHIGTLRAYSQWVHLTESLYTRDLAPPVGPRRFSGAHMIVRAVAGVCAGGFPPTARGEDAAFGRRLEAFAEQSARRVLPRRDVWIMRTAIRESARTGMSFGPIFANIKKHGSHPLVRNPQGRHLPRLPLTTERLRALRREVFRDPRRKAYVLNAVENFSQYKLKPRTRAG